MTRVPIGFVGRLRAWAELARLSNLPTVISNVLVGAVIAVHSLHLDGASMVTLPWAKVLLVAWGVMLLYTAGMVLNDVVDAEIDAQRRPERPIPSGRVARGDAARLGLYMLLLGTIVIGATGWVALQATLVLVAVILLYDLAHHVWGGAVLLMGMCRVMVYVVAAAAVAWPPRIEVLLPLAGALFVYIVAITVIAQREHTGDRLGFRRILAILMPLIAVLVPGVVLTVVWAIHFSSLPENTGTAITGALAVLWIALASSAARQDPPDVKSAVHGYLSGLCLMDAFYLTLMDHPGLAVISLACFVVTCWAHRHVMGT